MSDWINRQRKRAVLDTDEDELLQRISDWQSRARAAANDHSRHQTKKALRDEPPRDSEAGAIYQLYAMHSDTIWHVCHEELSKASQTEAITIEDVLAEAYVLFQRALIQYDQDRGKLKTYLGRALRRRVQIYIDGHSHETTESDDREEEDKGFAPGFNLGEIYQELVDEGRVSTDAQELFEKHAPSAG